MTNNLMMWEPNDELANFVTVPRSDKTQEFDMAVLNCEIQRLISDKQDRQTLKNYVLIL